MTTISPSSHASGEETPRQLRPRTANERYFLEYVIRQQQRYGTSMAVLDFGCGLGEKVRLLRQAKVECFGAEIFYGGSAWDDAELVELVDAGIIREIAPDGRLNFDDASFDLIISDQVIEHVENLDSVAAELNRVLRPAGRIYHQFPTLEILREVHSGIPLAHRLPPGSIRFAYALTLRRLGLGSHKEEARGLRSWTHVKLAWIDRYCFYRPMDEVERILAAGRSIRHDEADYVRARARGIPILRWLLSWRRLDGIIARAFRRVGSTAVELD
jgi:SAM-dependent methyltransferase